MTSGRDKILLVEDDVDTRELMAEVLSEAYEVIQAADAEEAQRLFDETVHLVVTDESLPGRTGSELAIALKEHHPDVRILLVTGFRVADVASGAVDGVLEKPVSIDALFATLERTLGRPSSIPPANLPTSGR
jgi:DNA-binding response OmpR family regulator